MISESPGKNFSGPLKGTSIRTFLTIPILLFMAVTLGWAGYLFIYHEAKTATLFLVSFGLAIVVAWFISGRMAGMMLRLNTAARSFADNDSTGMIAFEGVRELNELTDCFNTLANRLRSGIDTLERKAAEQAATISSIHQESTRLEREHRHIFQHHSDGLVVTDMDGRFLRCNPAYEAMTGYTIEELNNRSIQDITPQVWHDFESALILKEVLDQGFSRTYEKEYIRKDGTFFPVELSAHLFRDDSGAPAGMWALVRDISDRKLAEQALRKGERLYMDIVELLPDATFAIDLEGRVIAWNRAMEIMTGVLKEEMLGKGDFAYAVPFYGKRRPILIDLVLLPDDDTSKLYSLFEKKGETLFAEAYVPMTYQGKGAFLWAKASPLSDAKGNRLGAVQSLRDITVYRLTEENLKQTRDYLENVLQNSPDPIGIVDEHGRFVKWNSMATETFGFTFEEMRGRPAFDIYADETELHAMLTELRTRGAARDLEMRLKRRDGGIVPVELSISLLKADDGRTLGSVCVARDLSEQKKLLKALRSTNEQLLREIADRKKAELALIESENTYRAIFENTGTAMVILEEDSTVALANAQCEKLSGYSRKEIAGKMSWTEFIAPDDLQGMREFSAWLRQGPEVIPAQREFNLITRQGHIRNILATVGMIPGSRRSVASLLDMTAHKRMEEDLLRVQKLESIGILAGGIAHDFNNLLGIILGNISLARMNMDPDSQPFKALKEAEKVVHDSKFLTQQLITFSRGGSPVRKLESIQAMLEGTVSLALAGSDMKCQIHTDSPLWHVNCDLEQMRQILMTLLMNARDAMPEGGVVEVEAANLHLEEGMILSLKGGNYVRISIKDHGKGIPEAHLTKIFDPYFSTKERGAQKGMGLGLAIAYSVVKRHEGHMTVASQKGVGTTFQIYLPAIESSPAKPHESDRHQTDGKARVLFMDDEGMFRDLGVRMLNILGYEVESAGDGTEAIQMFRSAKESGKAFDVVILDLSVRDGMGAKEAIRELIRIEPSVKAIVSSGSSEDPVLSRFEASGFVGALRKPYAIGELREALTNALAKRT